MNLKDVYQSNEYEPRKAETAIAETRIREQFALQEAERLRSCCECILIVGSVAYGANYSVSHSSDLDIVLVVTPGMEEELSKRLQEDVCPVTLNSLGTVDIWDFTHIRPTFKANYICWSQDFWERLPRSLGSHSFFARRFSPRLPNPKLFFNFNHQSVSHEYSPVEVEGGIILDYPVHLINDGRYFAGIPVEQLLSLPRVLTSKGPDPYSSIEALAAQVIQRAKTEGSTPLLQNLLLRRNKLSPQANEFLNTMTEKLKDQ